MSRRNQRKREARDEGNRIRREAEAERIFERRDPLKQYVRRFGWLIIIEDYINRLREAGVDRPWKYLTLPGKYSIDIGLLWRAQILDQTEDGRLSVAICDQKYAESVATDLRRRGGILAYSNRRLDRELEEARSVLRSEFPFDVINLDLCNALIDPGSLANLNTIEWIFKLQRGQSFLLLLTTRPDHTTRDNLLDVLTHNLDNEELFREAYQETYRGVEPERCLRDYTRFTQIVFPKAVARWARYRGYRTIEHFVAKYRRPGGFDMVCHSFEFEPLGLRAPTKFYMPRFKQVPQSGIDERLNNELSSNVQNLATNAYAEFISGLPPRSSVDIVRTLTTDPRLEAELGDESESLIGWA